LEQNKIYYTRSLERIQDVLDSQQAEIERLKKENKKLRDELQKGNKELKGRIIRLEDTLKE
jgi:flagellar motor switch protein FliM